MIQQRPVTTDIARVGPLAALLLAAGLSVGFVAGQATPDLFGSLFGASVADSGAIVLPQNVDYGIRHIGVTESLSSVDDYGVRHLDAPTLTDLDDYGVRHLDVPTLTEIDDYGTRHSAP
jgi:hypothetical protein